jgi:cardiolipin synthase A/B
LGTLLFYLKKKYIFIPLIITIILSINMIYHNNKPLPKGLSYEGDIHYVEKVDFLYDITYKKKDGKIERDSEIFNRIFEAIENAEDFIVIDMFLFNSYVERDKGYPKLAETMTDKLISKVTLNPDLNIVFITDPINTSYGSHMSKEIELLKENDIEVVVTDLTRLRDPNPIYSSVWRTFFQWFGQEGKGWFPNPLAKTGPKVTLRSYLDLLNIKANHRKVIATEKTAIISSANPHDASGFHSNIAFQIEGNIISDLLKSEQATLAVGGKFPKYNKDTKEKGNIAVQLLTEGKIYKHLLDELDSTVDGDEVWIGMFYLADRKVVESIERAAERDVKVFLILDPNQNAFGSEKIGLPNLPVAAELEKKDHKNIIIRWYHTKKEQYHSKLIYLKKEEHSVFIGGSANFTERNLNDFNLETDIKITAPVNSTISKAVEGYFHRIWNNTNGIYTVNYNRYQDDLPVFKYIAYRIQKLFDFTTY